MASQLSGSRRRERPESDGSRGMPALRLLPIVIVAAICMLGLRIEVVVQTIANARRASLQVSAATALAQAQTPASGPSAADKAAAEKMASAASGDKTGGDKMASADQPAAEGDAPAVAFDPSTLTKAEIETLQRLSERRGQIEKREQDVGSREAVLKAGEARIDGKIVQLQDLEKSIQALLQKYDKQKQAEIDQLVKIYGDMKPKEAAGIFNTLDMPILVSVIQNMKEAKVAPIMAQMNVDKARQLTEELSQKKQFTGSGG